MKKRLIASALTATMALPMAALAADYTIDTKGAHASIDFKVSHLGYSYIQGRFNKFEGTFSYDAKNVEASKVTIDVDTTSLDSNHAERDKHLKGKKYINASKFSTAKFVSTKVTKNADGSLAINGDMTFYGVTKPVIVNAYLIGEGNDPCGLPRQCPRCKIHNLMMTVTKLTPLVSFDAPTQSGYTSVCMTRPIFPDSKS